MRPGGAGLRPPVMGAWAAEVDDGAEQRKYDRRQSSIAAVQRSGGGGGQDADSVPGFMFVCSGATESECLERGLLGLQGNKLASMGKIGPGTRLFLLNFRSHELFGPFKPDGKAALDIVPEAWKRTGNKQHRDRGFPAQIRIATGGRYWKVAHRLERDGPLDTVQTEELEALLADSGRPGTVALGGTRKSGHNYSRGPTQPVVVPAPAPAPALAPPAATGNPSTHLIPGNMPGYMFVCSSATESECFSRQLFGLGARRLQSMVSEIRERSTPIFLLNFKKRVVHGVFEAVGRPAMNIEADAWCEQSRLQHRAHALRQCCHRRSSFCCRRLDTRLTWLTRVDSRLQVQAVTRAGAEWRWRRG